MVPIDESWFDGEIPDEIGPNVANEVDGGELCRLVMSSGTTAAPRLLHSAMKPSANAASRIRSPQHAELGQDRLHSGLSTNYGYSFCVTTLWLGRTICFAFDATRVS